MVVVAMAVVGAVAACFQGRLMVLYQKHEAQFVEYGQRGTIMFVTMQILLILNETHTSMGGKEPPSPYTDFLSTMNFMALDVVSFVPFDCL